ncbi:cytochrome P450 [Fomitopsis betulina]|nr:cytochrome P450 [Fomitopsis betulina]
MLIISSIPWLLPAPLYVLLVGALLAAWLLWKVVRVVVRLRTSSMRDLPGPPSPSWFYGNLAEVAAAEARSLNEKWTEQYGHTITYRAMWNSPILYTVDTRAINHILGHSADYWKPKFARVSLREFLGEGLLVVEGEKHRQEVSSCIETTHQSTDRRRLVQRRVMNPAFGPAQIRELTEIFVEKAGQLSAYWKHLISTTGEPARIEAIDGLTKMTLDVIGLAGFNYDMDALHIGGESNELNSAFSVIFGHASNAPSIFRTLRLVFPILQYIPTPETRRIAKAKKIMHRVGLELIREKRARIMGMSHREKAEKQTDMQSRDLLTLLIKANMGLDIPEHQRMSEEDILAQVPTFLVAGHETTSNATAWALYSLAAAPEIQNKLREEIYSSPMENPSMDELNELEYLDFVVRETLRLHAPVPSTIREAVKDDVIPLNTPFTDTKGQVHDSVKIDKGTNIVVPILELNRSKAIWGEDTLEFRPERWAHTPEAAHSVPGVWSNMMTFLGGPRACIGFRFSVVEMKALLYVLIRAFEFELAVPKEEIVRQRAVVQRPIVRSEMEKGSQLPMLIKAHNP